MEEKNRRMRAGRNNWIEFSVILVACNLKHCLRKAIQSVLDQEFKNFELIIVDDGSANGSLQVVEFFRIPVLTSFPGKRRNCARRNIGLNAAKGKYVAFLDGDDYWYPDHLKMAFHFSESIPAYMFMPPDMQKVGRVVSPGGREHRVSLFFRDWG